MVKTRHSDEVSPMHESDFMTLNNEKSRRQTTRNVDDTENNSRTARAYTEGRNAFNIFEEKPMDSRLRPRTGPGRAYNYLDADSSEEDVPQRSRHFSGRRDFALNGPDEDSAHRLRQRRVKAEMLEEESQRGDRSRRLPYRRARSPDDYSDGTDRKKIIRTRRDSFSQYHKRSKLEQDSDLRNGERMRASRRTLSPVLKKEEESEETQRLSRGRPTRTKQEQQQQQSSDEEKQETEEDSRRTRVSLRRSEREEVHEDEIEDEETEHVRRSSRKRRQVFDTLNQSYLVSMPGKSEDTKEEDSDENNQEFSDMYSRVKRKRIQVKRNMYGVPINDDDSETDDQDENGNNKNDDDEDEDDDDDDDGEQEEDVDNDNDADQSRRVLRTRRTMRRPQPQITVKSYSLRQHKPRTDLYKAPVEKRRVRRVDNSVFATTPTKNNSKQPYQSPAHKRKIRKRSAFHSSSSSTSSSESESSDEKTFKRRKAKSLAKARNRMMPMNMTADALASASVLKDRVKSGVSLADVEPMHIDKSVTFESVGGLGKHIRKLKEMVVFPLLYDNVFQRFKIDPPRGVLFYGPPGTGKTLVARALANECSQGDRRVAFFMRKGADCLSKWVGESERQLRLLFDQAYKFRPSIIFFDEIDGLAPVRSSRQDQIHSSIVSTLLALMDGLDSRGEIVVIGATNRIDSLDPALRRPGRFDREFLFPLPSLETRKEILKIHTRSWHPRLNDHFLAELAEKCVGYCGADLKALCTEAAMQALRRRYPQIYLTNEALQLDVGSINVSAKDFYNAILSIIPTSQRSVNTPARALPARVAPLLQLQLDCIMDKLGDVFPASLAKGCSSENAAAFNQSKELALSGIPWEELLSDEDEDAPSIFVTATPTKGYKVPKGSCLDGKPTNSQPVMAYLSFTSFATSRPTTFRPRLMLVGCEGQGQTTHLAPAVIHQMENLPIHVLDLPTLYAVTAKTPEESCANVFHEAKRKCPSILYLPYMDQWWDVMADTLRATLLTLIQDLDPALPLLLLATSERPYHLLDPTLRSLFSTSSCEVSVVRNPNKEERHAFFKDLLLTQAFKPPPQKKQAETILKLLDVVKQCKTVPKKMRKLAKVEQEQGSPLPNFIYPFGRYKNDGTRPVSRAAENTFEVDVEPLLHSTKKASLRKAGEKCMQDSSKAMAKLSAMKIRLCDQPILTKSDARPSHQMVLRSKANAASQLNSNQSARSSKLDSAYPVLKWNSRSLRTHRHVRTQRTAKSCPKAMALTNRIGCVSAKNREKLSDELSSRHRRYIERVKCSEYTKSETTSNKALSECSKKRSFKGNYSELSAQHSQNYRQLEKVSTSLESRHSDRHVSGIPKRSDLYRRSSSKAHSTLSCGSCQMFYKKSNGSPRPEQNLTLPLNLRELAVRLVPARRQTRQKQRARKSLEAATSARNGLAKVCRHHLYNLRKKVTQRGNDFHFGAPKNLEANRTERSVMAEVCHDHKYNLRRKRTKNAQRMLESLPRAAVPKPRELSPEELALLEEKEELTLMELRIFLRDVLNKLGTDKKFSIFAKPVNIEDAADYYDIIETPMDLSSMMAKIDLHEYSTVRHFLNDIDLICSNALEYNPDRGPMDRVIRHRACALKDTAYAIIKTELDKEFEKTCVEIQESRKRRGQKSSTVPNFYNTRLKHGNSSRAQTAVTNPCYLDRPQPVRTIPKPEGERFSRRVRGLETDPTPPLEVVEKVFKSSRSGASPSREEKNVTSHEHDNGSSADSKREQQSEQELQVNSTPKQSSPHTEDPLLSPEAKDEKASGGASTSSRKKRNACVWCRPRRKRHRMALSKAGAKGSLEKNTVEESDGDEGEHLSPEEEEEEMVEEEDKKDESTSEKQNSGKIRPDQQLAVDTSEGGGAKPTEGRSKPSQSPASASFGVITRRSSTSPRLAVGPPQQSSPAAAEENSCTNTASKECSKASAAAAVERRASKNSRDVLLASAVASSSSSQSLALPPSSTQDEKAGAGLALRDRPSVVKRLDLDMVITDSGHGSSLESNGDSRDSTDHKDRMKDPDASPISKALPAIEALADSNANCSTERSRTAPSRTVIADLPRMTHLLNRLVVRTEGHTVERLEKMYSHLSQLIYRHRHNYNKLPLMEAMETKVEDLTRTVSATSTQ